MNKKKVLFILMTVFTTSLVAMDAPSERAKESPFEEKWQKEAILGILRLIGFADMTNEIKEVSDLNPLQSMQLYILLALAGQEQPKKIDSKVKKIYMQLQKKTTDFFPYSLAWERALSLRKPGGDIFKLYQDLRKYINKPKNKDSKALRTFIDDVKDQYRIMFIENPWKISRKKFQKTGIRIFIYNNKPYKLDLNEHETFTVETFAELIEQGKQLVAVIANGVVKFYDADNYAIYKALGKTTDPQTRLPINEDFLVDVTENQVIRKKKQ